MEGSVRIRISIFFWSITFLTFDNLDTYSVLEKIIIDCVIWWTITNTKVCHHATTDVVNNKILKYNSTSSKWEISDDNYDDGLNNVSEDTSPELGGNLNATNFDIINIKDGQFGGNVVINGNLTVSGDTTTVDVTQLEVEDPMIYLNRSGQENTATYDSGILIERYDSGNQNHAGMIWDESDDEFAFFTSPNITASTTTVTGIVYANVRAGDVKTKNILPDTNTTYDIGSSSAQYNTIYAKATSAQYADLAELYRTVPGSYSLSVL